MPLIPRTIRIEPAFDDPGKIRAMFERHAPYRALAAYAPEGVKDETREEAKHPVLPSFRGDWALDGRPLVEGAGAILHKGSPSRGQRWRIGLNYKVRKKSRMGGPGRPSRAWFECNLLLHSLITQALSAFGV